ncbi:putative protein disulfide-isomerase [Dioscorea sansibarensis]
MSRFNVQGFPTILVFGADKDSPYPYPCARFPSMARVASAIESFALEQLDTNAPPPEVSELTGPTSVLLPPYVLLLFSLTPWTPKLREGISTSIFCYQSLKNLKRVLVGLYGS